MNCNPKVSPHSEYKSDIAGSEVHMRDKTKNCQERTILEETFFCRIYIERNCCTREDFTYERRTNINFFLIHLGGSRIKLLLCHPIYFSIFAREVAFQGLHLYSRVFILIFIRHFNCNFLSYLIAG